MSSAVFRNNDTNTCMECGRGSYLDVVVESVQLGTFSHKISQLLIFASCIVGYFTADRGNMWRSIKTAIMPGSNLLWRECQLLLALRTRMHVGDDQCQSVCWTIPGKDWPKQLRILPNGVLSRLRGAGGMLFLHPW